MHLLPRTLRGAEFSGVFAENESMGIAHARGMGYLTLAGSAIALAMAPIMVAIKYMTGWAIIPAPFWVPSASTWLATAFPTATPAQLWTGFGTVYSIGLLVMLLGLLAFAPHLSGRTRAQRVGYWILIAGLALVLPGDAIHSWTWHQRGITVPTPGSHPVANTAYAVHMMGMNFVMLGSAVLGTTALRQRTLERWLASSLSLVFPGALMASLFLLPTTPSGALWLLSIAAGLCGYAIARGRSIQPSSASLPRDYRDR
jgi:hypothetical protein